MLDSSTPAPHKRLRPLLVALWLERKRLIAMVLGAAVLALALSYVVPRDWTAEGTFVVQDTKPDAAGGLSGLTQKFGIDLSSGGSGYSPRFYAWLLKSDAVLSDIATLKLKAPSKDAGRTVMDALKVKGKTPEIRRARAMKTLDLDVITASYDQRVEITDFKVTTDDAELSTQIGQALFDHLNAFVTEHHQSRASVERKFVEERRIATNRELMVAEDALADYVVRNRGYQRAPEQTIEYTRLARKVRELESVLSTLTDSYEKARIEEVRDSPVLSAVDSIKAPVIPDPRSRVKWMFGAIVLVLALRLAYLLAQRFLGFGTPASPADPQSFREVWPTLKAELRRPWLFFTREQSA